MNTIRVKAPATVANLVCGFDILGLCVDEPYDIMEVKLLDEKKVVLHSADNFQLTSLRRIWRASEVRTSINGWTSVTKRGGEGS